MRYEVTLGKEVHSVEVKEVGPHEFDVAVDDGPPTRVDAMKTPRTVYSILLDGRQFEGSVDEREDGSFDIRVGASAFEMGVVDMRRKLLAGSGTHAVTGKQELRAQMPCKVVKILAQLGESVEEDQGLVIIEAMKMENELQSPIAGVVTEVAVAEGDTVEMDALLVVVEPPEDDG